MSELPTQPKARPELQILRTRHPPAIYLNQLCILFSHEDIATEPNELSARLEHLPQEDRLFLAVEGELLLGYAHLSIDRQLFSRPSAQVTAIIVRPDRRRQGYGRRLIAAAETWALQAQFTQLILQGINNKAEAESFFTALGYMKKDDPQPEYVRDL
jgi:GNAT superfamily N-acetyltransferase